MAQWIPKTAWKASNLNKRYGQQYVTGGFGATGSELAAYEALHRQRSDGAESVRQRLRALADGASSPQEANPFTGAVVLDLRGAPERRLRPLAFPTVAAVHPHDLLSGAANPILPHDKERTELFLVTTELQRAVNSSASLRRLGYHNVTVVDYETVTSALEP